MLRVVIFSLFLFLFSVLNAEKACAQSHACPAKLQEDFVQNSLQAVETMKQSQGFQSFLTESNQQRDAALADKNFQEIVVSLQAQALLQRSAFKHQRGNANKAGESSDQMLNGQPSPSIESGRSGGMLYIFVSFSMGEKALLNLAQEAKVYGTTLILRGFKGNSYAKTVHALQNIIQKTGQGFLIDPELFTLFGVATVPTYVLAKPFEFSAQERSQTPFHDRLQGHVSIRYALEKFAKDGDLQEDARTLLAKVLLKEEVSK